MDVPFPYELVGHRKEFDKLVEQYYEKFLPHDYDIAAEMAAAELRKKYGILEPDPTDAYITLKPKKKSVDWVIHRSHTKELVFRHGHIAICDYEMGDNPEFEKSLSVWDEKAWKWRRMAGYYVKELKEFRLPRGYDIAMLVKFFAGYRVRFDNDSVYPADAPDYNLMVAPRDDAQRVALTFLCSKDKYKPNSKYTTLALDMATGEGKTYCCIAAGAFMRARTMVVAPIGKLHNQWKDSYLQFTDLKEKDIMIVRGSEKCLKILNGECRDVKIFIFSAMYPVVSAITFTVPIFARTSFVRCVTGDGA